MTMVQLAFLNCIPAVIRDRPRYVGDHVIRHYRPLGLAALLADLHADPTTPELTITGGIGTLTLRADGRETWSPTTPDHHRVPPPPPRPASPQLAEARRQACQTCLSWKDFRCTTGCGCSGEGKPENWSSRCPQGLWPPPELSDLPQ